MGIAERRARHKEALRRQILDAAREVFVKEGYECVSMRKIAERIEYSPTTIYLYFRDKAELLSCLCEEVFARMGQIVARILEEPGDPVAKLSKGLAAYVDFGLQNPNDYRVAFLIESAPRVALEGPLPEQSAAFRLYHYLRRTLEECLRLRGLSTEELEAATQYLWASVHGVTSLLIIHPAFPWVDRKRLIELTVATAIRGLGI